MRNLIIILLIGVLGLKSMAQVKITNETHGFIPNERNPMILTKYVEPGNSGKSVMWDFSDLEIAANFAGIIQDNYVSKCCGLFPQGNIVLEEFGNFFVFEASQSKLEQFGYLSSTGSTQIVYSKPFVKMQYPFTYGSVFSGNFEGDYIINGNKIGEIYGSYKVEGDANGVLKLPNGKELDNTLRVKEVKTTKQVVNNTTTSIEDITYRWYVSNHRFPVLVLIKSTYSFTDGNTSSHTKAAFNSNVVNINTGLTQIQNDIKLDIYPNPYQGRVNIEYNLIKNSNVNISVFDLTGKLVQVVVNGTENAGTQKHHFSASELGMPAGAYIVKIRVDNSEISRKILEIK
ncbi:MAG: T9SS type A sorting domain-containing protein [Bacteroidales bacterium]|nr:MAG: T9SS type A sorting domain-containing protein [Bacteroidales bacterium]